MSAYLKQLGQLPAAIALKSLPLPRVVSLLWASGGPETRPLGAKLGRAQVTGALVLSKA